MRILQQLPKKPDNSAFMQSTRETLSHPTTSLQLCLVGIVAGCIAAGVIILFRGAIHFWHHQMFGEIAAYQNFEALFRLLLPVLSIVLILAFAFVTGFKHYRLGVPYVIHRLKIFYGHIPLRSSLNQFVAGILALGSGFVVGKEGPSVHLSAAASHYVGRWLRLPFNSLRIVAGCGIAAGIAAAFNTPFAAVIFVMEVVLRDYKVHVFIPIMLAAACGSLLTRLVFGDFYELAFLTFSPMSSTELFSLVFLGIAIGCLASLFNKSLMTFMRFFKDINMFVRLLIAAAITGIAGFFFPQALGSDFVGIENIIAQDPQAQILFMLFICKFVLAIAAISLGVPGGIIGASMIIGVIIGAIWIIPLSSMIDTSSTTTYALLGLAGFLGSVLFAPMAALSAAMELAADSRIVLPAIIVIVSACVTSKQFFNNKSIFIQQLDFQGLAYTISAIRDWLQHIGVLALVDKNIAILENQSDSQLLQFLSDNKGKRLIHQTKVDVESDAKLEWVSLVVNLDNGEKKLSKKLVHVLTQQHTLADVHDALQNQRENAIVVVDRKLKGEQHFAQIEEIDQKIHSINDITQRVAHGIITWSMLHNYLLRKKH